MPLDNVPSRGDSHASTSFRNSRKATASWLRAISGTAIATCLTTAAVAMEPLQVHPQNPYIFKFRGEATVLRTFGEHYGSVINEDFDYIPYLDVLKRDGQNLTRVILVGFRVTERPGEEPLAPSSDKFLQPWMRSTAQGMALDGAGKWDFTQWNEAYFTRLRNFAQACADRGIVVEMGFFSTSYGHHPDYWALSPFHPSNNLQGYGSPDRYDSMRPTDANLFAVQQAAVRRIVRELNSFDNIYYEIQNEPFWNEAEVKDAEEVAFHNILLGVIRDEESGLPNRHLVAHNFPEKSGVLSPDFDIINSHYPYNVQRPPEPPIIGGEELLATEYSRGKILALDESSAAGNLSVRVEAWMFVLGGGAIYNGLDSGILDPNVDLAYPVSAPAGDTEPSISVRRALRELGTYTDNLHLPTLRRNSSWITGGIPSGARVQAMASTGQQYVAYLHNGAIPAGSYVTVYYPITTSSKTAALQVTLPAGSWEATWTRPDGLTTLHTEEFSHAGGSRTLQSISYQADVALRIDRTGAGDTTPPPVPKSLVAAMPESAAVGLSWDPVAADDIASYHVYHSAGPGVQSSLEYRVAVLPPTQTTFTHGPVAMNSPHRYVVTAVDGNGNESAASREVTSQVPSQPFGGTAWTVPGTIECEDFDTGGEGIACHDLTPGNAGNIYRLAEDVDLTSTSDSGGEHHVTGTQAGEWLNYSIRVAKTDTFDLDLRCASAGSGAQIQILIDGVPATAPISLPATDPGIWQTVRLPDISLSEGSHVLRISHVANSTSGDAGEFNRFSLTPRQRVGPNAYAGADQVIADSDWDLSETVTLNAASSVAGTASIVSYSWTERGVVIATGINPTLALGSGRHRIVLVTTDSAGLTDSDELFVTIGSPGFVNGGFETNFSGWSASGSVVRAPVNPATEGSQAIYFNGGEKPPNGAIWQVFPTVPGQVYRLRFDMGVLAMNQQEQRLQLDVSGNGSLLSRTYSAFGSGGGTPVWSAKDETFTANDSTATVTFRDMSSSTASIDLLLDHVRITRVLESGALPDQPSIQRISNAWKIRVTSPDTGFYKLQRSTNLATWQTIEQRPVTAPGLIEFTDSTAPDTRVFYRVGLGQTP